MTKADDNVWFSNLTGEVSLRFDVISKSQNVFVLTEI